MDRKRKKKNKVNKTKVKKTKIEEGNNTSNTCDKKTNCIKKCTNILNNIYKINLKNSTKTGQKLLEWLIHPISVEDFIK